MQLALKMISEARDSQRLREFARTTRDRESFSVHSVVFHCFLLFFGTTVDVAVFVVAIPPPVPAVPLLSSLIKDM